MEESQNALKKERKKMNEFKEPAKKKKRQRKVTTHSSGCTTTTAAAAKLKQQQKSFGFSNARFTIFLHGLSARYRYKNFFSKETLTLKPWEKDKNILQTVTAIVKYDYFV